jgi:hypothetical protein
MRAPTAGGCEIIDDETRESIGVFRDMLSARNAVIVHELRACVPCELGEGVLAELNEISDVVILSHWEAAHRQNR